MHYDEGGDCNIGLFLGEANKSRPHKDSPVSPGEGGHSVKKLLPGMMLILEMEGYEVSVYPSGKIIVKLLDDAELGRKIAETIYECAGILEVVA